MTVVEKAIIKEGRYFVYAVYNNGSVTKTSVKDPENERPVLTYKDAGGVFVWIGKEKRYVKRLVARHFLQETGKTIIHLDGDEENCAVDNLQFVKRDVSNDKKIYTKVVIDGIEYSSIAAAERALMVSHGYLTRYFNGQRSGKAFEGHEVRIVD